MLTERAKSLIEPVTRAVAEMERVFAPVERFDPRTSRRVFRVAASDNLVLYVMPKLAAVLAHRAPWIDVRVTALPSDLAAALGRGDIDLKLGRAHPIPTSLEGKTLSREAFACVVRRGHPAHAKPTIAEYAALDHLMIAPTAAAGAEPRGAVDTILHERGLERRVRMTLPHFVVAPFVVASSDLALTAPARLIAPFQRSLALRRLTLPFALPSYELAQVWAVRSRDDAGHRWRRETIAGLFGSR